MILNRKGNHMNEQRRLPRWQIRERMNIRFQERYEFADGIVEDINMKGMCLALPARLPYGREVRMGMRLSRREDITVHVQISWIKEEGGRYLHGVEFKQILENDKRKISQYINDRCMEKLSAGWWHDHQ